MSDKNDFSTYAVTLYFDEYTTSAIQTLTTELAQITGNNYMTANSVPPHLTLGMFHVNNADVRELKELFGEFVSTAREDESTFDIYFSGFETFLDKVLFIKPEVDENLARLNKLLHEKFLPHFDAADNRNYLPGNWYPHIALGVKISHEQFKKGMGFLKTVDFSLRASVISIGLASCNPYTRVCDYEIENGALRGRQV